MTAVTYEQKRATYPDGNWADVAVIRCPADALAFERLVLPDMRARMRDAARLRYFKARIRGEEAPLIIAWATLEEDSSAPNMFPTVSTITEDGEHLVSANALINYTMYGLVRNGWLRWRASTWYAEVPPGYPEWQTRADVILGWLSSENRLWLEAGPGSTLPESTAFEGLDTLLHLTPTGRCGYIRDVARQEMPAAAFNSGFFLLEHDDYLGHHSSLGDPYGMQVEEGEIVRPPLYRRATLWQSANGTWQTGIFGMQDIRLILPNGMTLYPEGSDQAGPKFSVNPDEAQPIAIYTRHFGVASHELAFGATPVSKGRFELTVIDRRISGWKRGGGLLIPQNGYVLSFAATQEGQPLKQIGALSDNIQALQGLLQGGTLAYDFDRPEHAGMRRALQCGPMLLREGNVVASDARFAEEEFWISRMGEDAYIFGIVPTEYPVDVAETRAARIGIGIDDGGDIVIVAMSGSSKGIARPGIDSVGATLLELAAQLQHEGAVEAINLDGGGSTQVFVEGGLYNSPGDRRGRQGVTYERMVPTIGIVR